MRGIKGIEGIRDSFAKKKMWGEKKREHLPCISLLKSKKKNKQSFGELVKSDYRSSSQVEGFIVTRILLSSQVCTAC